MTTIHAIDLTEFEGHIDDFIRAVQKAYYQGQEPSPQYIIVSYRVRDMLRTDGTPAQWDGRPCFSKDATFLGFRLAVTEN